MQDSLLLLSGVLDPGGIRATMDQHSTIREVIRIICPGGWVVWFWGCTSLLNKELMLTSSVRSLYIAVAEEVLSHNQMARGQWSAAQLPALATKRTCHRRVGGWTSLGAISLGCGDVVPYGAFEVSLERYRPMAMRICRDILRPRGGVRSRYWMKRRVSTSLAKLLAIWLFRIDFRLSAGWNRAGASDYAAFEVFLFAVVP